MAKRPSAASTRSKQHQVLRYIYSTDLKSSSEDLNVSTKKLRQFVKGNPRYLKSRIQKDPVYRAIYNKDIKKVAKQNKVKLIPKLSRKRYFELGDKPELTEREIRAREFKTVTKVREYQKSKKGVVTYRPLSERQVEMQAARTELVLRGLPEYSSIQSLSSAFEEGSITSGDVRTIVGIWRENYGFSADREDDLLEKIVGEEVMESEEE